MDLMQVLGYTGALLTGFVLGLLGGGGALLAIPILVYLFKVEASVATGYSLFLVGITASIGAVQNVRTKFVDYTAAMYYGVPSVIAVYVVRRFVIPGLPKVMFNIGHYQVDKNHFILFFLCIVMFIAAYKMITSKNDAMDDEQHQVNHFKLMIYAILIGSFLGLVGAGGGFLMVPALIYFANLTPKKAIGTSLLLVSINSLIGFVGDVNSNSPFDWKFLFLFSLFSIAGVIGGTYATHYIHNRKLKIYFGWFILFVAISMVTKELFF